MKIDNVKSAFEKIKEGMTILGDGPVDFYLDNLIICRDEFFKRCAPFKIGDIVEITKAPNCDNGWKSSQHFLNIGRKCKVVNVDFSNGNFFGLITPEKQTWIDEDNIYQPIDDPRSFHFYEDSLRLVRET